MRRTWLGIFSSSASRLFTTVVSTRRVREITEQGVEDLSGSDDPVPEAVGLRAEHLSFTYDSQPVLRDVSFREKEAEP